MNEERAKVIWQHLTDKGKTNSDFQTWAHNVASSEDIQGKVHNYLLENKLTSSDKDAWLNNIGLGKTEDIAQPGAPAVSEDTELAPESGSSELPNVEGEAVADPSLINVPLPTDNSKLVANHPDLSLFTEADEGGFFGDFRKEKNIAEALNKYYQKNNLGKNIRFIETEGGQDVIEVLVGDQKPGEGQPFEFTGGWEPGNLTGLWADLMGQGGEEFTNASQFEAMKLHIERQVNPELNEGVDNKVFEYLQASDLDLIDNAQDKQRFFAKLDEAQGAYSPDRDVKGYKGLFGIDHTHVDMSGSLQLGPEFGNITVPYKYLWDNKDKFLDKAKKNDEIEFTRNGYDEHGLGERTLNNNPLTGVDVSGYPGYVLNEGRRSWSNMYSTEDREILTLTDMITSGESGVGEFAKKISPEGIMNLNKQLGSLLEERGIQPIWDTETGDFINITKSLELLQNAESEEADELSANADALARSHDQYSLDDMLVSSYAELMVALNIANENADGIRANQGNIDYLVQSTIGAGFEGRVNDGGQVNAGYIDSDLDAIRAIVEQGSIRDLPLPKINTLDRHPSAVAYNAAVEKFMTLHKAVTMNRDISQDERTGYVKEVTGDLMNSFFGMGDGDITRMYDTGGSMQSEEIFRHAFEDSEFVLPETNTSVGGMRATFEGPAQILTDLAPLLVEIAVANKALGGAKIVNLAKSGSLLTGEKIGRGMQKVLSKIGVGAPGVRAVTGLNKVNQAVAGGIGIAVEWSYAETIGEKTLGWKANTIDFETGETNFTMPFVMGSSGTLFGVLQGGIGTMLGKTKLGPLVERFTDTSMKTLGGSRVGNKLKPYTNLIGKASGQGATATGLLTAAELGQMNVDALLENGTLASTEDMGELFEWDHVRDTWIAMTIMSGSKMLPELKEAYRRSALSYEHKTDLSEAASKKLGGVEQVEVKDKKGKVNFYNSDKISENKNKENNKIDKEANEKIKKVEEKRREVEKKNAKKGPRKKGKAKNQAKINEANKVAEAKKNEIRSEAERKKKGINDAAEVLTMHNDMLHVQRSARAKGNWNEHLRKQGEKHNLFMADPAKMTDAELDAFSKLDHGDIEMMLYTQGVERGSLPHTLAVARYESLRDFINTSDNLFVGDRALNIFEGNKSARREFIQSQLEYMELQERAESLRKQIKENPDDTGLKLKNQREIKKLNRSLKETEARVEESLRGHEEAVKELLEREIEVAKDLAIKFGIKSENFKSLSDAEYRDLAKKEGFDADAEAFYDPVKERVIINKDKAAEAGSLGAPIHEVVHHLLKNSLKTVDKNGVRHVDEAGMKTLNDFMNALPEKTRKLVQERLDENYKYKEYTQKEYDNLEKTKSGQAEKFTHKGELKTDADGKLKVEIKEEYYKEEAVTALSDLYKEKKIKATRSTKQRVGDILYPIIKAAGWTGLYKTEPGGMRSIKAGEDLHQLVLDMYETSEAAKTSKGTRKTMQELKVTEASEVGGTGTVESRKRVTRSKKVDTTTGKAELSPAEKTQRTRDLGKPKYKLDAEGKEIKGSAKKAWDKGGWKAALREIQEIKAFDSLIAAKYKVRPVPKNFVKEVYSELTNLVKSFNPEVNNNFHAWINSQVSNKAGNIYKDVYAEKIKTLNLEARTSEGTLRFQPEAPKDTKVTKFEEADMSMGARAERQKRKTEGKPEVESPKSKLKKLVLKNNALANPDISSAELTNKFRGAVIKALKISGDVDATAKNKPFLFRDNIEKSFENDMFKSVKNSFGTHKVYEEFIKSDATLDVVKNMPTRQLTKAKMDFAYEPVLNAKGKQVRMSAEEMIEAGYPESYDKGVGPPKWKRKNFTKQDFIDWAQAKGKSGSTQGTRKDALARMMAIETAKDAVPTALRNPYQQAYDRAGKPMMKIDAETGEKVPVKVDLMEGLTMQQKGEVITTALEAKVMDILERNPNLQFSKKGRKAANAFDNKTKGLDIGQRISIFKAENVETKKTIDALYKKGFGMDYLDTMRDVRQTLFDQHAFHELKWEEANVLLNGNLKDLKTLREIATTNENYKGIVETHNKNFLNNQITYDGLKSFMPERGETKSARAENHFKRYGDMLSNMPSFLFENKLFVDKAITTGGQGKISTRWGFNKAGTEIVPRVQLKGDSNKSYSLEHYGKELTGRDTGKKVKMITNAKTGKKVPFTDAFNIIDTGKFKGRLAEWHQKNKNLPEREYIKALEKWSRGTEAGQGQISKKGFTWEQTREANEYIRNAAMEAITDYVYAKEFVNSKGKTVPMTNAEYTARLDAGHKLLQIQTVINNGLFKGLNTMRYITTEGPSAATKTNKSGLHAEHAFFNLAHSSTVSGLWARHGKAKNSKAFMEDYKKLELEQYAIQEATRMANEGKQYGKDGKLLKTKSNTGYEIDGNVFPVLNVLATNPGKAFKIFDLKEGKLVGEVLADNVKFGGATADRITSALASNINLLKQGKKKYEVADFANESNIPSFLYSKKTKKGMTFEEKTDAIKIVNKALANGRKADGKKKGMSTFDFDETLIVKGENFVTATKGKKTVKISSENFPLEGPKLEAEGYKFDFKDFVNVKGGVEGPLFKKLQKQIAKYGNENVFVLTARMPESAPAIHAWLKSKGVELPIENITGLGQSAGEAKGRWMLEKFSEGYNDMYFVDDAMPNVKAVKKVLDQLDIKSDVQQVMYSKKQKLDADVNDIMKHSLGIEAAKRFSKAEGRMRGKNARRRKLFVPDTAADLGLLLEPLYGKGKKGVENKKWFEENFYKKFERGINDFNTAKQTLSREYMALRKGNKDIVKDLGKEVPETSFSHDQAMRVYLWNKAGFKVPDLAEATQKKLVDYIESNPKYKAYAESFSEMKGGIESVKEPTAEWWAESIALEVSGSGGRGVGRKEHLSDFIEARETIFSEVNLNKMEAKLGKNWRNTIEDMFERMETGRSKSEKLSEGTNALLNYFNGSVGTIMSFNTRSGLLQLISSVNFVNSSFNNPARAALALANVPQYSKDFMRILNSDMLKQRRDGLEINVTEAEIAEAAKNSKNPGQAIIAKILKAGYLPTKMADSFAIASGGATYYRNAIKMYTKKGMSKVEAEKKAFLDFQAIAERTQQSSRPDLISKQQTTFVGKSILNFANTPMQMNRLALKEMLDIGKGRYKNKAEFFDKLGKIGYYGFAQTMIFAGLQTAAFAVLTGSDDDELKAKKTTQMLETVMDSSLRGMGISGAVLNGVINAGKEFFTQREKDYGADYSEVAEDLLSISPIVGSKFRKLDAAGNTYKYNRKQIEEQSLEFDLDNPALKVTTQVTEALLNIPVDRLRKKITNLKNAADADYAAWERFLMALGWTSWDVNPELSKKKSQEKKSEAKSDDKGESEKKPLPPGSYRDSKGILRIR